MYYQTLFTGALEGINSSTLMPGILTVASGILLLSLLYSVYSAYSAGGDVRILATSGVKYLILGLVFANYAGAFRDVNNMFNSVANYIVNSGPGLVDVFLSWIQQVRSYISQGQGFLWWTRVIWNLGESAPAAIIGSVLIFIAFLLYRITYLLFCLFYTIYGAVLYVTGPLVLALMPAMGVGQLARTYLVNLMIFNAWGLIYAILSELIYALHLNDVNTVLQNGTFLNLTANPIILLGIASLIYALVIALIPYIASRIVRGDVGSTLLTVGGIALAAASAAVQAAGTSLMGSGAGWSYRGQVTDGGGSNGSTTGTQGNTLGASGAGGNVDGSVASSSRAPRPPSSGNSGTGTIPKPWQPGYNMPGQQPRFSFVHAASWYTGYAAHAVYDKLRGDRGDEQ